MYSDEKRKGVLSGMRNYLKDRHREFGLTVGLWLFLNVYLGFICSSRLYTPDLVYLNLLFGIAAVIVVIRDYRRWKKLACGLNDQAALTEQEEKEILGSAVSNYVRRQREEQEKEWMDSAKQLSDLSDYIARWTHEAKLPLASLRLMNDRNEDEELRNEMQECIARLESLIQTVMVGSKLQRPENDVRYERISLEEAVKKTIQNQSYYLIHENFQISMELGGLRVYSDRRWLVYLLDQLVGNAVKYRSEDPCLSFRAARLDDGSTELTVEDNGIGILKEELPYIFQQGYVGKHLRRGDCRSTGMGLYFAKKIGDMMAISIRAESEPGQGSRFYLYFQNLSDHLLLDEK